MLGGDADLDREIFGLKPKMPNQGTKLDRFRPGAKDAKDTRQAMSITGELAPRLELLPFGGIARLNRALGGFPPLPVRAVPLDGGGQTVTEISVLRLPPELRADFR